MKSPPSLPEFGELFRDTDVNRLFELLSMPLPPSSKYFHWDELRRRPAPKGLSHEEWWLKLKLGRQQIRRAPAQRERLWAEVRFRVAVSVMAKY